MPNVTIAEITRLRKAEKELNELKETNQLRQFGQTFSELLGMLAAHTPKADWPREFVSAFEASARKHPTLARIYLGRLPE